MTREELADALDRQIDKRGVEHGELAPLLAIAGSLRLLPTQNFKDDLKSELMAQAEPLDPCLTLSQEFPYGEAPEFLVTLEAREFGVLPADPRSFLLSFISHAAVVVLIASGIWVGQRTIVKTPSLLSSVTFAPLPEGDTTPHGGGSGGDHSQVPASRGTPPPFAAQQIAPPVIVVRNPGPKLPVESTLQGPPELKLPESKQIGDLLASNVSVPSNGAGANGGIGSLRGSGIGPGQGSGYGLGTDGGCCTGVFFPGKGVTAPQAIYAPDPEYSDEARRVKHQGIVVLVIVVDRSGKPRDVRVARSLGMGLDQKAVEAVEKWKFTPGRKDGVAVATQVAVEVTFHLY